jgi:hypothetical protein
VCGLGGIAPPAWLMSLFMIGVQVQTKVENAFLPFKSAFK